MIYCLYLPKLQSFEIGENCLNKWTGDLVIDNYPDLEKIVVKKNSLNSLNSLKICNNKKLDIIEIEDGAFGYVNKVIFEGISIMLICYCLYLSNLQSFKIGENCLNKWKGDLVFENYPNLQSIVVKKNSLKKMNLLKICKCERLKTIEIDESAFYNVKNVVIKSIL